MALNSRGSIDPRWLTHNRGVLYALELARVEIFEPKTATQQYNPITNTWEVDNTPLWIGYARVQPIMTAGNDGDAYNPSLFQNVKIQLSHGRNEVLDSDGLIPDIRPNYIVRVTGNAKNVSTNGNLTNFIFVVTSVLNSSNAWERTLMCKVDVELDPTATGE